MVRVCACWGNGRGPGDGGDGSRRRGQVQGDAAAGVAGGGSAAGLGAAGVGSPEAQPAAARELLRSVRGRPAEVRQGAHSVAARAVRDARERLHHQDSHAKHHLPVGPGGVGALLQGAGGGFEPARGGFAQCRDSWGVEALSVSTVPLLGIAHVVALIGWVWGLVCWLWSGCLLDERGLACRAWE